MAAKKKQPHRVRATGIQGDPTSAPSGQRATMVEIDTDKPLVTEADTAPHDAWWLFAMPSQEAAPAPTPTQRYGWWAEKPNLTTDEFGYVIYPASGDDGPTMRIPARNNHSVYVAQMKHTGEPPPRPES